MKIRNRLLVVLMPLLFAATANQALADPPPWAPAHGERARHQHHYVYYPDSEVYYAPARHMWFWLSGNGWQAGAELPLALRAYVRVGGVNIELGTRHPYRRHTYVVRRYGGHRVHWRHHDRHEHEHEHGHGRGHDRGHRRDHDDGD
jgi:hypothetical protein